MNFLKNTKVFWIVLGLTFVIARMATWLYPFGSDHWFFYYIGRDLVQGGNLYITSWDQKGPLIFYFNSLMYTLFGQNLFLHRFFLTVFTILDTFLFYLLAKKLFNVKQESSDTTKSLVILEKTENDSKLLSKDASSIVYVRLVTILYAFWRNLSQYTSSGNNNENIAIIFLILLYLSFIIYVQKQKIIYLLASGFYLSFLFIFKLNFLILALPLFLEILILFRKNILKVISLGLVLIAPLVLHLSLWIWYFSSKGTLKDYYVAAYGYNSAYWRSAIGNSFGNLFEFIALSLPLLLPLIFVFFAVSLKNFWPIKDFKLKYENFLRGDNFYSRFIYFIAGSGLLFSVVSGTFFTYYFLMVIPGFVLLSGLFLKENLIQLSFKKLTFLNKFVVAFVIFCMILALSISTRQAYNTFKGSSKLLDAQTQKVADYIKDNSNSNDTIIAYMYGPTIYIQAERKAGTRFTSASFMLLDNKYKFGFDFNKTFIEDVEKSKSKYLVMPVDKKDPYYENKELVEYFKKHYQEEKTFEDFSVWRRV